MKQRFSILGESNFCPLCMPPNTYTNILAYAFNLSDEKNFFRPKAGSYPEPEKKINLVVLFVCLFVCLSTKKYTPVWFEKTLNIVSKYHKFCNILNVFFWNSFTFILTSSNFGAYTNNAKCAFWVIFGHKELGPSVVTKKLHLYSSKKVKILCQNIVKFVMFWIFFEDLSITF